MERWYHCLTKEHEELSGAMEIFYIMMVVTFTQLHEFVKTDQTELLKRMAFTVCKQYFNIPGFKNKGNYHQAQAKRGETG